MKVWISMDELWPDYQLILGKDAGEYVSRHEGEYEVPEKLYKDYQDAQEKYMELRRQIRDIVIGSDPL